jgi:hypothetical protein
MVALEYSIINHGEGSIKLETNRHQRSQPLQLQSRNHPRFSPGKSKCRFRLGIALIATGIRKACFGSIFKEARI